MADAVSTSRPSPAGPRSTVVFVHAHPDDEAIFTGGTIARLAAAGHRVVVVIATSGELGVRTPAASDGGSDGGSDGRSDGDLGMRRQAETRAACRALGVSAVEFLGYRDSGIDGDVASGTPGSFAASDPEHAGSHLATVLRRVRADAVVGYDDGGIYGHPDHVQVSRVTRRAAELAGTAVRYQATVDREYLHFVATHLVDDAHRGLPAPTGIGVQTALIDTMVDVRSVLAAKRSAIRAHRSQIAADSGVAAMTSEAFGDVYGYEWFIRQGPAGPIEALDVPTGRRAAPELSQSLQR